VLCGVSPEKMETIVALALRQAEYIGQQNESEKGVTRER
jgi:hypothetical protein